LTGRGSVVVKGTRLLEDCLEVERIETSLEWHRGLLVVTPGVQGSPQIPFVFEIGAMECGS
jgi:hypothetical protein